MMSGSDLWRMLAVLLVIVLPLALAWWLLGWTDRRSHASPRRHS